MNSNATVPILQRAQNYVGQSIDHIDRTGKKIALNYRKAIGKYYTEDQYDTINNAVKETFDKYEQEIKQEIKQKIEQIEQNQNTEQNLEIIKKIYPMRNFIQYQLDQVYENRLDYLKRKLTTKSNKDIENEMQDYRNNTSVSNDKKTTYSKIMEIEGLKDKMRTMISDINMILNELDFDETRETDIKKDAEEELKKMLGRRYDTISDILSDTLRFWGYRPSSNMQGQQDFWTLISSIPKESLPHIDFDYILSGFGQFFSGAYHVASAVGNGIGGIISGISSMGGGKRSRYTKKKKNKRRTKRTYKRRYKK